MPVKAEGQLLGGRYRVLDRLGSGGMATVFLCEDERLRRKVAVKRLHAESPGDTARRFQREARLGASLNHQNVVSTFDIVTDDEGVLIVMEYVEGETLAKLIQREGGLEPRHAVRVLRGVAAALDHAHGEGVVHRDVKPANILIGRRGEVKLVDLGIATVLEGTRITRSGTVMGTAAYMAPEQIDGAKPGPAADVYALATVAFEMLSGRKAREGRTPVEIARRVVSAPPPRLSEAWPEAPAELADAVERGMCRDLAERPRSASAFVDELEAALADTDPELRADPRVGSMPVDGGDRFGEVPLRSALEEPVARGGTEPAAPARTQPAAPARTRPAAPARTQPAAPARHESVAPRMYPPRRRRELTWMIPAAVAAILALVVAGVMLLSSGGDDGAGESGPAPAADRGERSDRGRSREGAQPEPAEPAPAQPAPAPSGSDDGGAYAVPEPGGDDPARGAQLDRQGKALIDQGRYDEAIPVLEEAVRSFPAGTRDINYAFALYNLGNALRLAGRPGDAIPVLERRLEIPNQRGAVQAELDRARRDAGR
jgi:predicted Ser/Thr protein kinase